MERGVNKMKTSADKFMESQKHSIYATYRTLTGNMTIHKHISPNGIINFIFQDGSIIQTDNSLNWIGQLVRVK